MAMKSSFGRAGVLIKIPLPPSSGRNKSQLGNPNAGTFEGNAWPLRLVHIAPTHLSPTELRRFPRVALLARRSVDDNACRHPAAGAAPEVEAFRSSAD